MGMPKFTQRLGRWISFRNSSMAQVGRFQGNIPWPRAGPICFQVFSLQLYRPKLQAVGGAVKGPTPNSSASFVNPISCLHLETTNSPLVTS